MEKIEVLKISRMSYVTTDRAEAREFSWYDLNEDSFYYLSRYGVKGYRIEMIPDDEIDPVFGVIGVWDSTQEKFLGYIFC